MNVVSNDATLLLSSQKQELDFADRVAYNEHIGG